MTPPVEGADLRALMAREGGEEMGGGHQIRSWPEHPLGSSSQAHKNAARKRAARQERKHAETGEAHGARHAVPADERKARQKITSMSKRTATKQRKEHAAPQSGERSYIRLGGELLAGRLATGGLAGGLLGASHVDDVYPAVAQ